MKNRFKLYSIPMLVVINIVLLWGCKGTTDNNGMVLPEKNLSYSQHIRPIFMENCIEANCHNSKDLAGGLDLETAFPTFMSNSGQVVVPEDPEHSLLFQLLINRVGEIPRMPLNRPPLPESYIRAIETWIAEGAKTTN